MATQTATSGKTNSKTASNGPTPVAEKITDTLHQSVDALGEQAAKTEEKLRDTADSSSKTVKENQIKAQKMWDKSAVGKYTKEHPVASAGIAFAAGVFITSLLKRN